MATREFYKWRSNLPGDSRETRVSRRTVLALACGPLLRADAPERSDFDLSLLDDPVVPTELFFIRNHFPLPQTTAAGWKLSVSGAVGSPYDVSVEELSAKDEKTAGYTLECAENPVGGGLVSHAEWTGIGLDSLLARAKPASQAQSLRLTGADGFVRTIPFSQARAEHALLAYRMNGERLPASHGYPLRAVIPGSYAMNSVKWVRSIEVLADSDTRETSGNSYRRYTRSLLTGVRAAEPVSAVQVKSVFARPLDGANLQGRSFIVRGAAWAGEHRVRRVEVSVDGEKTWNVTQLGSEPKRYAWVLWSWQWKIPRPGRYELAVRAEDDTGQQQPAERSSQRADPYEMNAWQRIFIDVA